MSSQTTPRYRLEQRPMATPTPMMIVDTEGKRLVAVLEGQASATMDEARIMVEALNAGL